MSMLPGLGNVMPADELGSVRIKRFLTVMDSMTNDELDGNVKMDETRINRICRGSALSLFCAAFVDPAQAI